MSLPQEHRRLSTGDPHLGLERRQYFSSSQGPFHNASNIFLFYGGGDRGSVVDTIVRAVRAGEPLSHVHGERGSGKTLLSLVLAERLAEHRNIIRFEHDGLSAEALLQQLTIELCPRLAAPAAAARGRAAPEARSGVRASARRAIVRQLALGTPGDRPVLLIIDSASAIDTDVQELLRELSAVRRQGRRMLQAVAFERMTIDDARALGVHAAPQPPGHHHWLRRLTLAEISDYLQHHMLLFDYNRRDTFSRDMAYFIADRSEGVFRSINTIARNAFMIAGLDNQERPSMSHLLLAGLPPREREPSRAPFVRRHRRAVFALFASAVVASLLTAILLSAR